MARVTKPKRKVPPGSAAGRGRRGKQPAPAGETRMQRFAARLERALEANESLPSRRSDRRVMADLAELEIRAGLLSKALRSLVSTPRSRQGRRSFEMRLISLVYEVTGMHDLTRSLRGPLMRLVKDRCAREKQSFELLTMAGSTIRGLVPPREASRRSAGGAAGARKGARRGPGSRARG